MTPISWIFASLLLLSWVAAYWWWRGTAKEHYSAIHYAIGLLLDPETYATQREFFLGQVLKRKEATPRQLSVAIFSGLSVHATRIFSEAGTARNQIALWHINQAGAGNG